jgi:hypothetical protein
MSKPSIGFVGLGAMGFGMATHLVKEGYAVHGFDVFPASVERFKAAGGIPASSLQDSAKEKDFYVCMVASAPQVQSVLFGDDGIAAGKPPHPNQKLIENIRKNKNLTNCSPPQKRNPPALLHRPSIIRPIRRRRARLHRQERHSLHRRTRVWWCAARRCRHAVDYGWCV